MGRIGYCEVCGVTEQRRAAEIYDGVDNPPDACWQCERALKFEQERIIDLLMPFLESNRTHFSINEARYLLTLIKGENK